MTETIIDIKKEETVSLIRNSIDDKIICRYCFEIESNDTIKLINPCNCTTPVCIKCFRYHLITNQKTSCEICRIKYNIDLSNKIFVTLNNSSDITPQANIKSNSHMININNSETHQINSNDITQSNYRNNPYKKLIIALFICVLLFVLAKILNFHNF